MRPLPPLHPLPQKSRLCASSQLHQITSNQPSGRYGAFAHPAKKNTQYPSISEAAEPSGWRESVYARAGYAGAEWRANRDGVCETSNDIEVQNHLHLLLYTA